MMRRSIVFLSSTDIGRLASMRDAIRVTQQAFRAHARGRARMPAKVYLAIPEYAGDFRAMPAYMQSMHAAGMKWVNVHPQNVRRGLPTVMGVVVLNDPRTGVPLAVLEGTRITELRTGAAGGVAARALARPNSRTVALVGCGRQAATQLEALMVTHRITQVRVWGPAITLAKQFIRGSQMKDVSDTRWQPAATVEACVRDADIVVTTTPSQRPLVRGRWLAPGVHVNAIGADAPGKRELAWDVLRDARVYVDEWVQAAHGGEINIPVRQGQLTRRRLAGLLGDVLVGTTAGRRRQQERTVFDSTGLAIQDIALAHWIYKAAIHRRDSHRGNVGRRLLLT